MQVGGHEGCVMFEVSLSLCVCVFVGGAQRFVCFDMKMINEWRFKDES